MTRARITAKKDGAASFLSTLATPLTRMRETPLSSLRGGRKISEWAELANGVANLGFWKLAPSSGRFTATDGFFTIHGLSREQSFTLETVLSRIHDQDQDRLRGRMKQAVEFSEDFTDTYRARTDDGVWRMIRAQVTCGVDDQATAPILRGLVTDVTETELFRVLAEKGHDLLVQTDLAGHVTYISPSVNTLTGFTPEEVVGLPIAEIIGAPSAQELEIAVRDRLTSPEGRVRPLEYRVQHKDGQDMWLEARPTPIWDAYSGRPIGLTDVLRDITERKKVESRLELANVILKTQMDVAPHGILLIGADGAIIALNRRFAEIFGLDPSITDASEHGDTVSLQDHIARSVEKPEAFVRRMQRLVDRPEEDGKGEIRTRDGRHLSCHSVCLQGVNKAFLGWSHFVSDVTGERKSLETALRMARADELTGLANRRTFVDAVYGAIAKANRMGAGFAILFMDLDHFKDVNDTLGHPIGDEMLRQVTRRLRNLARETDTVARFGGDEFAMVASEIQGPAEAAALADRLIRAISEPFTIQGNVIYSGLSIGLDLYGPASADVDALLSHADLSLYRAKTAGGGCYRFFTPTMESEARTRVTLAAELHEAIAQGQLFLLYQPQFEIKTGRLTGVEAQARWNHPTRGVIDAGQFTAVAEQMGLMVKLGHWALWSACRQARAWRDAGLDPGRVCVNVSSVQFKAPIALESDIASALRETGLPPACLELELTESVIMNAAREDSDVLGRLGGLGVGIAIDDFGTGYSSLDYLRRFPVNRIKIAQAFIRRMETSPGDAAIVKATISLARDLGIAVIAEGVETSTQLAFLKTWACAEAQGFLLAPPLRADAITRALKADARSPALA